MSYALRANAAPAPGTADATSTATMSPGAVAARVQTWPPAVQALLTVLAAMAAHGIGSWFIVSFRGEPLYVIWPGVGIGLATLYVFGRHVWPWVLLGSVAVQWISTGNFGFYTWLFPVVDTLEAFLAVTWLRRAGVDITFGRVADVWRYVLWAAVLPTALGAIAGLSAAVLSGDEYYRDPVTWMHWWLADLQSILHGGGVLLTWAYAAAEGSRRWPHWTWPGLLVVVIAASVVAARTAVTDPFAPAVYMLPVMLVLAAALGHGPRGATLTSLATTFTLVLALPSAAFDQATAVNLYAGIEIASLGLLLVALTMAALIAEVAATARAREVMAAQLTEAQRLDGLGRIAAGVAHDFNNLLTGILGNAALLRLTTRDANADRLLGEIEDTSQRAAELCRQMLTVGGLTRRQTEPIHLSALVEDMARVLRSTVGRQTTLHFDLATHLPVIDADATQVRQVLMNLVVNAAEAGTPGQSHITLRVSDAVARADAASTGTSTPPEQAADVAVRLDVVDRGSGMDAETVTRIFDPFFTTKFVGRGLGLAVVHGIVRTHGARITVDSQQGRGTSVSVLWPTAGDAVTARDLPRQDSAAALSVLIVDSDPDTRAVTARLVREAGGTAVVTSSMEAGLTAGLDACRAGRPFDVVLFDEHAGATPANLDALRRSMPGARCIVACREPDRLDALAGPGGAGVVRIEKPFGPTAIGIALGHVSRQDVA